jgi:spore germination protein YaaH
LDNRRQVSFSLMILLAVAGLLILVFVISSLHGFWQKESCQSNGTPLVIVWELAAPDISFEQIGDLGPVKVVSPTWFHLDDSRGSVRSNFDPQYLQWARERGYLVWALVSNSFDPEITAELLADEQLRQSFAEQIVILAVENELDGLNIDFENFHHNHRKDFTRLISELAVLCRQADLTLSVDVTMPSNSEYWSMRYDRSALAAEADFIIGMAYDEHWEFSAVAGSVASLPWVERGLQLLLKEVPAEKLILGVPFYSRLWVIDETGTKPEIINSWTFSMSRAAEIIKENDADLYFDDQAGQNVAIYMKEGLTYKMWLEDDVSMRRRLELVQRYNLAGLAGWRRGLETPEIWELMECYFQ